MTTHEPIIAAALELPTPAELLAFRLRRRSGLSDGEIAELLGLARETVNRRIGRAQRKILRIRQAAPGEWERLDAVLSTGMDFPQNERC